MLLTQQRMFIPPHSFSTSLRSFICLLNGLNERFILKTRKYKLMNAFFYGCYSGDEAVNVSFCNLGGLERS